jgi:segregation and condensation protein B
MQNGYDSPLTGLTAMPPGGGQETGQETGPVNRPLDGPDNGPEDRQETGPADAAAGDRNDSLDDRNDGLDDRNDGSEPGTGLAAGLEAIMLVADEPVPAAVIAEAVQRSPDEVTAALTELARGYTEQGRGFDLREVAGGWRLYTRDGCAPVVERFVSDGLQVRLTQAALETLAVVAYRQPVSRSRVSAVRGVNCDGVMRTLVLRGLVEEGGADTETGAILFRTTSYFLERLGLAGLEDLPDLAPFLPDQLEDEQDPGL